MSTKESPKESPKDSHGMYVCGAITAQKSASHAKKSHPKQSSRKVDWECTEFPDGTEITAIFEESEPHKGELHCNIQEKGFNAIFHPNSTVKKWANRTMGPQKDRKYGCEKRGGEGNMYTKAESELSLDEELYAWCYNPPCFITQHLPGMSHRKSMTPGATVYWDDCIPVDEGRGDTFDGAPHKQREHTLNTSCRAAGRGKAQRRAQSARQQQQVTQEHQRSAENEKRGTAKQKETARLLLTRKSNSETSAAESDSEKISNQKGFTQDHLRKAGWEMQVTQEYQQSAENEKTGAEEQKETARLLLASVEVATHLHEADREKQMTQQYQQSAESEKRGAAEQQETARTLLAELEVIEEQERQQQNGDEGAGGGQSDGGQPDVDQQDVDQQKQVTKVHHDDAERERQDAQECQHTAEQEKQSTEDHREAAEDLLAELLLSEPSGADDSEGGGGQRDEFGVGSNQLAHRLSGHGIVDDGKHVENRTMSATDTRASAKKDLVWWLKVTLPAAAVVILCCIIWIYCVRRKSDKTDGKRKGKGKGKRRKRERGGEGSGDRRGSEHRRGSEGQRSSEGRRGSGRGSGVTEDVGSERERPPSNNQNVRTTAVDDQSGAGMSVSGISGSAGALADVESVDAVHEHDHESGADGAERERLLPADSGESRRSRGSVTDNRGSTSRGSRASVTYKRRSATESGHHPPESVSIDMTPQVAHAEHEIPPQAPVSDTVSIDMTPQVEVARAEHESPLQAPVSDTVTIDMTPQLEVAHAERESPLEAPVSDTVTIDMTPQVLPEVSVTERETLPHQGSESMALPKSGSGSGATLISGSSPALDSGSSATLNSGPAATLNSGPAATLSSGSAHSVAQSTPSLDPQSSPPSLDPQFASMMLSHLSPNQQVIVGSGENAVVIGGQGSGAVPLASTKSTMRSNEAEVQNMGETAKKSQTGETSSKGTGVQAGRQVEAGKESGTGRQRAKQMGKQAGRQAGKQAGKQAGRQAAKHTAKQRGRQAKHTDKQSELSAIHPTNQAANQATNQFDVNSKGEQEGEQEGSGGSGGSSGTSSTAKLPSIAIGPHGSPPSLPSHSVTTGARAPSFVESSPSSYSKIQSDSSPEFPSSPPSFVPSTSLLLPSASALPRSSLDSQSPTTPTSYDPNAVPRVPQSDDFTPGQIPSPKKFMVANPYNAQGPQVPEVSEGPMLSSDYGSSIMWDSSATMVGAPVSEEVTPADNRRSGGGNYNIRSPSATGGRIPTGYPSSPGGSPGGSPSSPGVPNVDGSPTSFPSSPGFPSSPPSFAAPSAVREPASEVSVSEGFRSTVSEETKLASDSHSLNEAPRSASHSVNIDAPKSTSDSVNIEASTSAAVELPGPGTSSAASSALDLPFPLSDDSLSMQYPSRVTSNQERLYPSPIAEADGEVDNSPKTTLTMLTSAAPAEIAGRNTISLKLQEGTRLQPVRSLGSRMATPKNYLDASSRSSQLSGSQTSQHRTQTSQHRSQVTINKSSESNSMGSNMGSSMGSQGPIRSDSKSPISPIRSESLGSKTFMDPESLGSSDYDNLNNELEPVAGEAGSDISGYRSTVSGYRSPVSGSPVSPVPPEEVLSGGEA